MASRKITVSVRDVPEVAEQIAALTAERDRLHATVERVRRMHRPDPNDNAFCQSCDRQFPCPTWRELDGAP